MRAIHMQELLKGDPERKPMKRIEGLASTCRVITPDRPGEAGVSAGEGNSGIGWSK
jgi:hypothetical protein